jgi:hypothetical protein
MSDEGTLWMDWPSAGGRSPDLPIQTYPFPLATFRHHSDRVSVPAGGRGLPWVAASGIRGLRRMEIGLASDPDAPTRRYTVRLHFAEADHVRPGERVFDVRVQDKKVLADFDIVKEAGGPMEAIVKEVPGVEAKDTLKIELTPAGTDQTHEPLLSGVEIVAPRAATQSP